MPAGKPAGRVGINELPVNFFRYIKIFVRIVIGKINRLPQLNENLAPG